MTDRNKFEEMLEKLVNEDRAGAEALFHEIVVEKSRDIYENLLEDDLEVDEATDEEVDEATDEEVDETTDEDLDEDEEVDESDEELEEGFDLDEFEVEADVDAVDDMMGDLEMPAGDDAPMDMDDDDADDAPEGDVADDIADLQDEIEKLKAAFDAEMGTDMASDDDEEGDKDDAEGEADSDEEEAPEEESFDLDVEEATDEEVEEADKSETETMREYVEKVNATMGDNGANTKSPTASANKMGDGTSANIVAGGESNSEGTKGGLADPSAKEDNMGNINVPGGKAGKAMKAMSKGHGAEKKGAGETASDKKSIIGK